MSSPGTKTDNQGTKTSDDFVLVFLIIIGIVVGLGSLILACLPALVPALFFSLTSSSVLFRFLGGTDGSVISFENRANNIKFNAGASVAAFFVAVWGFNYLLENQLKDPLLKPQRCRSFEPDNWIPIDRSTGLPVSVEYSGTNIKLRESTEVDFSNVELSFSQSGRVSNNGFIVGRILDNELDKSVSTSIRLGNSLPIILELEEASEIPEIPFKIKITCLQNCFKENHLDYQLLRGDDNSLIGGTVRRIYIKTAREFHVFQLDGKWYFLTILDSCQDASCSPQSATFLVNEIIEESKFSVD